MIHIRKESSKAALIAAASALVLLLAGCQSNTTASQETYIGQMDNSSEQSDQTPDSPQKTYSEQESLKPATDEPHANFVDTTSDTSAETSTLHKTENDNAITSGSEDEAWDADHPTLLGIAIGDREAKVNERFGDETDSYVLDEESDKIQVHEYDGFAVGINGSKTVQYVEIYSENISAGLSGLQIGDQPDAAIRLLGKPEKQTTYLLSYEADGAMLKLDLDPSQNKIISIKLLYVD
jgi:hypothetical protein